MKRDSVIQAAVAYGLVLILAIAATSTTNGVISVRLNGKTEFEVGFFMGKGFGSGATQIDCEFKLADDCDTCDDCNESRYHRCQVMKAFSILSMFTVLHLQAPPPGLGLFPTRSAQTQKGHL